MDTSDMWTRWIKQRVHGELDAVRNAMDLPEELESFGGVVEGEEKSLTVEAEAAAQQLQEALLKDPREQGVEEEYDAWLRQQADDIQELLDTKMIPGMGAETMIPGMGLRSSHPLRPKATLKATKPRCTRVHSHHLRPQGSRLRATPKTGAFPRRKGQIPRSWTHPRSTPSDGFATRMSSRTGSRVLSQPLCRMERAIRIITLIASLTC